MENSSKLLLIIAAVLIVILIVIISIKIFNPTEGIKEDTEEIGGTVSSASKEAVEKFQSSVGTTTGISSVGKAEVNKKVDKDSTINGQLYNSKNPIIPSGFIPIDTETSKWGDLSGPQVDNGLVISDGNSEFVWVPVTTTIAAYGIETNDYREPDVVSGVNPSSTVNSASGTTYDANASNLTLAGCTQDLNNDNIVNAYDFKIQLENEFKTMAKSVNKYGGFYVGRYEMSLTNNKTAQSKYGERSSNNYNQNTYMWYGLYEKSKTYTTNSVKSSMIWGSQYDAMIKWMGDAANQKIGNNRNKTRYTGTVETDKIKNVYDLYGNSFEWTIEAKNNNVRISRGGYWGDNNYKPNNNYLRRSNKCSWEWNFKICAYYRMKLNLNII